MAPSLTPSSPPFPNALFRNAPLRNALSNPAVRAVLYQIILFALVAAAVWTLADNTADNLRRRGIAFGFDFLWSQAGVSIGETPLPYVPSDSFFRALAVGFANTLRVAVSGVVLATLLGVVIGVLQLSRNWILRTLASGYVEVMRNLPLLVQLFFWYTLVIDNLPNARNALNPLPGVFLSNRGIRVPYPVEGAQAVIALSLLTGLAVALLWRGWSRRRNERLGAALPVVWPALALFAAAPVCGVGLLALANGGAPLIVWPSPRGLNLDGGANLTPEFTALLIGLTTYTAAFIAEIVRSGILAVNKGQIEAAEALGLKRSQVLRFVLLPQALRVALPPTTTQYLALTKNSSLAVAIGYPDLLSLTNTMMNKTGQAIEAIAIMMAVYLSVSLLIALVMTVYERAITRTER